MNAYLKQTVEAYEPTMPFLEITTEPTEIAVDNDKLHLCTGAQAKHVEGAERAAANYWRHGREKCATDQSTGYGVYSPLAYEPEYETQRFNDPGMGLGLECLSSFLTANNARKILDNHVDKKIGH